MLMRNASDLTIKIRELNVSLAPGATIEIEDGYAHPRLTPAGARVPSIIEMLAPTLRPADKEVEKEWLKAPKQEFKPPTLAPTVEQLVSTGMPPGVAELVASGNVAAPVASPRRRKGGL